MGDLVKFPGKSRGGPENPITPVQCFQCTVCGGVEFVIFTHGVIMCGECQCQYALSLQTAANEDLNVPPN